MLKRFFIKILTIPVISEQIFIHENLTVHTETIVLHDSVKLVSYFQCFLKFLVVLHYSFTFTAVT